MLCLTCTIISSVDLAHSGVSCAKDYVFVDCDTREREHGLFACTRDNPRALAKGLSTIQAHKPCSISTTMTMALPLCASGAW